MINTYILAPWSLPKWFWTEPNPDWVGSRVLPDQDPNNVGLALQCRVKKDIPIHRMSIGFTVLFFLMYQTPPSGLQIFNF